MAATRTTFTGDADTLRVAIAPFATSRLWLQYSQTAGAGMNVGAIRKHGALIRALRSVQSNLSFPRKAVERAMQQLADARGVDWNLKAEHIDEFVSVSSARLRAMCRHVANAMVKKQRPAWLTEVLAEADETVAHSGGYRFGTHPTNR